MFLFFSNVSTINAFVGKIVPVFLYYGLGSWPLHGSKWCFPGFLCWLCVILVWKVRVGVALWECEERVYDLSFSVKRWEWENCVCCRVKQVWMSVSVEESVWCRSVNGCECKLNLFDWANLTPDLSRTCSVWPRSSLFSIKYYFTDEGVDRRNLWKE